jgi:hypothetical protein
MATFIPRRALVVGVILVALVVAGGVLYFRETSVDVAYEQIQNGMTRWEVHQRLRRCRSLVSSGLPVEPGPASPDDRRLIQAGAITCESWIFVEGMVVVGFDANDKVVGKYFMRLQR